MTRSKTRTIDLNTKKTLTRDVAQPRVATREQVNRPRRRGGTYAVVNKKKGGGTGVSVSPPETANGKFQVAIGAVTLSLTKDEASDLVQSLVTALELT